MKYVFVFHEREMDILFLECRLQFICRSLFENRNELYSRMKIELCFCISLKERWIYYF